MKPLHSRRWMRYLAFTGVAALIYAASVWAILDPEGPLAGSGDVLPVAFGNQSDSYPRMHWERIEDPQAFGFDPDRLNAAQKLCRSTGASAIVVVADGRLLLTWGFVSRAYPCHSIRKSLVSALYGNAVADGMIRLEATLKHLEIDELTPLTAGEKSATVKDLLSARSGVYLPSSNSTARMRAELPKRGSHPPGTFWFYNNWDFNALGTIYSDATGVSVFEAFQRQIAVPIEMENFEIERDTRWNDDGRSRHRGYEFWISGLDLARFGLLFLRDGRWKDRQIVPADWVIRSTEPHSVFENGRGGYGYMWWVESLNRHLPEFADLLQGSFSAEGMGGHGVFVIPRAGLVVVVRADTRLPAWMPLAKSRVDPERFVTFMRELLASKRRIASESISAGHRNDH